MLEQMESWRKETADSYPAPIKPTPSCSYSGAGSVNLVTCGLYLYSQLPHIKVHLGYKITYTLLLQL